MNFGKIFLPGAIVGLLFFVAFLVKGRDGNDDAWAYLLASFVTIFISFSVAAI